MRGLLAGFGGVWKTWLKFVRDDVYVRSLVVKTPTSICWRLLSVLAFGLTIVGLAWNEPACLCKWNTRKKFRIILSFSLAVLRLPCQVLAVKNDKWEEAGLFWTYSLIHPVERIYYYVKRTLCDIKTIYET